MMKNLLVLMLVLCVASIASATIALSGPATMDVGGDTITVIISGGASEEFNGSAFIEYGTHGIFGDSPSYGVYLPGPFLLDNGGLTSPTGIPAGSLSGITKDYAYAGIIFYSANVTAGATITAGNWFQFDLTLASGQTDYAVNDTVELNIFLDDLATPYASDAGYTITIVPEPMTMALLGLGGLFLRRRK